MEYFVYIFVSPQVAWNLSWVGTKKSTWYQVLPPNYHLIKYYHPKNWVDSSRTKLTWVGTDEKGLIYLVCGVPQGSILGIIILVFFCFFLTCYMLLWAIYFIVLKESSTTGDNFDRIIKWSFWAYVQLMAHSRGKWQKYQYCIFLNFRYWNYISSKQR